jgi:5'-methylthioadenosine phosphorylase
LIGGTGVGTLFAQMSGVPIHVPTSYGMARGKLIEVGGRRVAVLSRHSAGHSVPPHRVNYRAMASAMHQLGIRWCLASAAVGSLREDCSIGTLAVCSDFLDLTGRNLTVHDDAIIHTPFAQPFGVQSREALLEAAKRFGEPVRDGGVYIGLNGPRFETPHEIRMLARLGDFVGMTASSEAVVMKEAGIQYGLLAVVTNLGEGLGGAVEHEMVGATMLDLGPRAVEIFKLAVEALPR